MNEKITTPINGPLDLTSDIFAFEEGTLDNEQVVQLFQHLIDTGIVWQLQGTYGRTARDLIYQGLCTPPKVKCGRCGGLHPSGQSCGCFDNHCE